MDVAFSRDQKATVYVQHRLWERRADLWAWLQDGARLYVCGDEKQMAQDVHALLRRIAADQGGLGEHAAADFVAALARAGRYPRDLYCTPIGHTAMPRAHPALPPPPTPP